MKTINQEKLKNIKGGYTLTSTFFSGINILFRLLAEAGERVGSGLRRIESDKLCPIK